MLVSCLKIPVERRSVVAFEDEISGASSLQTVCPYADMTRTCSSLDSNDASFPSVDRGV